MERRANGYEEALALAWELATDGKTVTDNELLRQCELALRYAHAWDELATWDARGDELAAALWVAVLEHVRTVWRRGGDEEETWND